MIWFEPATATMIDAITECQMPSGTFHYQWRIQDFPQGGAPTPKIAIIFQIFAKNCMKMKEFGPPGGRASLAPPLRSANDYYLCAKLNADVMF